MVNPEHPKTSDDLELEDRAEELRETGEKVVKAIGELYLVLTGEDPELVDYEDLPEDEKEDRRFTHRKRKMELSRGDDLSKNARQTTYKGQSAEKVANRAAENPYIMSDILSDPGLVDAESATEAVAKVADQNPGWAKVSDAVEAHGLEADADGNVSPAGEADAGETGAAEAASNAASFDGDVSTADAGDLGPTGPSGYSSGNGSTGGEGSSTGSSSGSGSGGDGAGGSSAGDGGLGSSGGAGGDAL